MPSCRSCGAPIRWALTAKDKPMPIDPEPSPDGNLELYRDDEGEQRVRVLTGPERTLPGFDTPPRYKSHFTSCPQAPQHRRK